MVKLTEWTYSVDPYELYMLVNSDIRIPKSAMARKFKVNKKTAALWWNKAVEKKIIIPPFLRKRAYENFKEYFQFYNVKDPHIMYKTIQKNENVIYACVQTGFANLQVISKKPIELDGKKVFTGVRSDYYISKPLNICFKNSISLAKKKIQNLDSFKHKPSPLIYHKGIYQPWDEIDEKIYTELHNNMRKPFLEILENIGTYSEKIQNWFKRRNEFGQTIVTFFPHGEPSYMPSLFLIETSYDSLIIDIFSSFPVSNVFYRINDRLIMCIYLPFYPSPKGRYIVREILSILEKKELVKDYTNSIVEYYYRPD